MMNSLKASGWLLALGLMSLSAWADGITWQRERAAKPKSGTGTSFAIDHLSLLTPVSWWQGRDESLETKLHLTRTEFEWDGANALGGTYYWVGLPLHYQQKRSKNVEFVVNLELGVMTDAHVSGSKTVHVDGELSARLYSSKNAFWQLGGAVDRAFGNNKLYPVLAYAWQPDSVTAVQLGFPYSHIEVTWSHNVQSYARAKPAGGIWLEKGEADIRYQSWQLATGASFSWREGIWLNAEIGGLFRRQIEATDSAAAAVTATPKNNLYWGLGAGLSF